MKHENENKIGTIETSFTTEKSPSNNNIYMTKRRQLQELLFFALKGENRVGLPTMATY
jgi:hypothetical protein